MNNKTANILVIDDVPDNLRLISAMLATRGYKVRKALNGEMALKTIKKQHPDLILLDINMPGMNGYDVCFELKKDDNTKQIPIIFISAIDEVWDKVKAFKLGAVDYISKPFQSEEVLARIEHQLTICWQKNELKQEIEERQKAEEALRVYLHVVSHDLRNPVIGMSMVIKNLLKRYSQEKKDAKIPVSYSILERIQCSCDRQLTLINSLVETQQFQMWEVPLENSPINLYDLTQQIALEWQPMLDKNQAKLENKIPKELPLVNGDFHKLWRVWENLIANALKHNPPGVKLTLNAQIKGKIIFCSVTDNGIGIQPEEIDNLFQLYRRGNAVKRTTGLGLGLYLCRQIIKAHLGEIGVDTKLGEGSKFWFTLPIFIP